MMTYMLSLSGMALSQESQVGEFAFVIEQSLGWANDPRSGCPYDSSKKEYHSYEVEYDDNPCKIKIHHTHVISTDGGEFENKYITKFNLSRLSSYVFLGKAECDVMDTVTVKGATVYTFEEIDEKDVLQDPYEARGKLSDKYIFWVNYDENYPKEVAEALSEAIEACY